MCRLLVIGAGWISVSLGAAKYTNDQQQVCKNIGSICGVYELPAMVSWYVIRVNYHALRRQSCAMCIPKSMLRRVMHPSPGTDLALHIHQSSFTSYNSKGQA